MEDEELQPKETTKAQARQNERRDRYARVAGEALRQARHSQFSLLPYEELARVASEWYDACAEGMLASNFAPIDNWVRQQARMAAEEGFEREDLLELFRICRRLAIEKEGWQEEQFADVDPVIDEALAALRGQVAWDIPDGLDYLTGKGAAEREAEKHARREPARGRAGADRDERRRHKRNHLKMPLRVRGVLRDGPVNEVTRTENVGKGGVYFLSEKPYFNGARLQVMYPYWENPGGINPEYPAQVVRVDAKGEKQKGVALKFLVSLGPGA